MTRLNISYYMDEHGKVNNDCKIKFFLLAHYMVHNFVTYNQNHYIIVLEARKTKNGNFYYLFIANIQVQNTMLIYFTYFHVRAASNINF